MRHWNKPFHLNPFKWNHFFFSACDQAREHKHLQNRKKQRNLLEFPQIVVVRLLYFSCNFCLSCTVSFLTFSFWFRIFLVFFFVHFIIFFFHSISRWFFAMHVFFPVSLVRCHHMRASVPNKKPFNNLMLCTYDARVRICFMVFFAFQKGKT